MRGCCKIVLHRMMLIMTDSKRSPCGKGKNSGSEYPMIHPVFSIIVPIYKVEAFLPQCIDSVLQQDYEDFELILVDDGSPDNCLRICDEYAQRDMRIRVLHENNSGVSEARNAGVDLSQGEYIIFLDGDDYLTERALKSAYSLLVDDDEPDLLMRNFVSLFSNGDTELSTFHLTPDCGSNIDYTEILTTALEEHNEIPWTAWRNIYKTSVVRDNNVRFERGLVDAEDCAFFMEYVKHVTSYAVMNYPLVNYRVLRAGSITASPNYAAIMAQLRVFSRCFSECATEQPKTSHDALGVYFAEKFANVVSTLYWLKNDGEIRAAEDMIRHNRGILTYARGKRYVAARIVWKVFGYHKGSQPIHLIRSWA